MTSIDQAFDEAWTQLTASGAQYEVTSVAVDGISLRQFREAPGTLREIWATTDGFGARPYLIYANERLSYAQAQDLTGRIAAWLDRHGVVSGDRVAIAMRNYPEWLLIYWACVSMGVVVVGLNAWWLAEEMAYALVDSAPKVIFCDSERLARLNERAELTWDATVVAVRAPASGHVVAWVEVTATPGTIPLVSIDSDNVACIFYTSGTTGFPKGAQMTHRGCINNLLNIAFAAEVHGLTATKLSGKSPERLSHVSLVTTPLFHVTANNCQAHPITAAGGTLVLMHKWEAGEALSLIEAEHITHMSGVPTMARELIRHPNARHHNLSSLRVINGGGAQLPPDLVTTIGAQAAPSTGYGMTEASGTVTASVGDLLLAKADSCGRALPTFETRVIDDSGDDVPAGAVGELLLKGAGVIKGYLNQCSATEATIIDGWLRTGDLARIDAQGFIFIVDRKKDMVLRGGENVYCAEVEMAMFQHPAVAEVCVFGVEDERLGEEVGAAIVLRPDMPVMNDDLRAHAHKVLARYKVPRYIWVLDTPLPRNANGKYMRRELRAAFASARPEDFTDAQPATVKT